MKAMGDLLAGLAMLAVFAAAGYGVFSAVTPEQAKGARDRAIRVADRLGRDDLPPPPSLSTKVK